MAVDLGSPALQSLTLAHEELLPGGQQISLQQPAAGLALPVLRSTGASDRVTGHRRDKEQCKWDSGTAFCAGASGRSFGSSQALSHGP